MAFVGKSAWISFIWLTGVMTLVAGMPHFACHCPDGRVKPLCLGSVSEPSGCCCGGACCSSFAGRSDPSWMAPGQFHTRSCCQHQQRQANASSGQQQAVGPQSCTRIVASCEISLVPSRGKLEVGKDLTASACLLLSAMESACPPAVAHGVYAWQSHQVAPPTDLTTTLQRFLI
jgi:hypothetical protein